MSQSLHPENDVGSHSEKGERLLDITETEDDFCRWISGNSNAYIRMCARKVESEEVASRIVKKVSGWNFRGVKSPAYGDLEKSRQEFLRVIKLRHNILSFPEPSNWPISFETVNYYYQKLKLPERGGPYDFNRDIWRELYEKHSADEIQFIIRAFKYHFKKSSSLALETPLLSLTYFMDESEITIREMYNINNRGKGEDPERVIERIELVFEKVDPVFAAICASWLDEVKTNLSDSDGAGSYSNSDKYINIKNDSYEVGDKERLRCTTAHEFGHALHYIYGFNCSSSLDNRDKESRKEWEIGLSDVNDDDLSEQQKKFRNSVIRLWKEYKKGRINEVREYQQKNVNEFIACGFELWIINPERLRDISPSLFVLFNRHFRQ